MSYTAIPPQDRALKSSCNGYVKRSTLRAERGSCLKSPASLQRRTSGPAIPNSLRKSAPEHQEIYEGFTFLDEQRRKTTDFCPVICCSHLIDNYLSTDEWCNFFKCGTESINPFAFKNINLERIYAKYFSLVYRSTQLARFFLLIGLFCLVIGIIEMIPTFLYPPNYGTNVRCWISISMAILTIIPLIHINCQQCMRPQHMAFLKFSGFILCCGILVAVSPIWGDFKIDSESFITVGLWETIWLIITISCFYPVTFYTLLALTIFLCMSHSIISILLIVLSKNPVFSSKHWAALSGNWLLFIPSILIGSVISYLQQKMLRNAFLYAREFLNSCVENKMANEKLDRLLSCVVPMPIVAELKQSIMLRELHGHLPSVVHLRNVSFINVEICGLSRGAKGDGNGISFSSDAVKLMNELFSRFDMLGQELGCYQVRVHPDDYLSLAGYPETRVDHAKSCTELAFRIHHTIKQLCDSAEVMLDVRTVVHTGVTYGAVLGNSRMVFDLLGDDVRILRFMLGIAAPGKVMVSKSTYDQLPEGYKGDLGPRLDLPLISMSMSSSGDSNRMDTYYLRPKHMKQNSILATSDLIVSDTSDSQHDETITKIYKAYPLLTNLLDGNESGKYSQKTNQNSYSQSQTHKSLDYNDTNEKGCEGHNSRSGQSDSLSSSTNQTITKTSAFSKLAQTAKFNANIPYYFLTDDSFLLSSPDDDRLLLDIGGAIVSSNIHNATGSPIFHGTTKSSASWKSTLKSQFTQSLIGSYQIDEDDISLKKTSEIDLSISRVTNTFLDPTVELKFQNQSEKYMGLALLVSLSTVLFITSLHALMLAKTVMLLLMFLVVFMWIGLLLLLILLVKMKFISGQIVRSYLCSMVLLIVTSLGIFTLIVSNSFCCANFIKINSTFKQQEQQHPESPRLPVYSHLQCPLPVYIPYSTIWVTLPLIVMLALPETFKVVIVLVTAVCTCVIIFGTHNLIFTEFSKTYRLDGIPVKYMVAIVPQIFFAILVLWKSRILNTFRRLVFQWQMKMNLKREEHHKLIGAVDRVIDILLPKFVVSHYFSPSRNYMNLFSYEYKTIGVLSVSIPSWCPVGVKEPSDVANNIRVLNQLLITFDDVMESSDYEGIIKIRTAGETAWYAVGIDPDHPIETSVDRIRLMTNLLRGAEMLKRIVEEHNSKNPENRFLLRIGIHMAAGFSGVVGGNNPTFGVWGEAYFGATVVQRCGQLDKIHVTSNFMAEIDPSSKFGFYDVGTLIVNHAGQLISVPPGQWAPGTMTLRVFMLREKNLSHGSMIPNSLVPMCSDESIISIGGRRNSLTVVMASGEPINHYMINSTPVVQHNTTSSLMSTNPLIMPRNGAIPPGMSPNAQNYNNNSNGLFSITPITSLSILPSNINSNSPLPSNMSNIIPSINSSNNNTVIASSLIPQPIPQILPQKSIGLTHNSNLMKCPQESINRKSILETQPKIHHYRNLATELPDSVIPPSPPPHRRIYPDTANMNLVQSTSPIIVPQTNQFIQCQLEHQNPREKYLVRDINPMTQSAISPPKERNTRSNKCITPSSSMDSFLELEKACSTNPRTKSANYSIPPNERLSLIPESYKLVPETDLIENESYHNAEDIGSVDIMTTSDDRIFDVDQTDIMSHHNPMYTDNEYESMAESQANLLDPMEEIRRSRLINKKQIENDYGSSITDNLFEHKLECINSRGNTNSSNSFGSNIINGTSFDFPDYRRPASPNGGVNGDDSDHLSKRNRNSSNSRDSSSIAAHRSGGATSSDESGKKESNNNCNKILEISQSSYSNGNQISVTEDISNGEHGALAIHCGIPNRDSANKAYDNGSSCISLVTDLGWTSCDDEDMYSDYPGYAGRYKSNGDRNNKNLNRSEWVSKWSDSNDLLSSNVQGDDDDSDIDCIRFHSDLISDLSENPLVSDLETETDCDFKSSNPAIGSMVNENRLNSYYKFPVNNILNPEFYGNSQYRSDKTCDDQYSKGDNNSRMFAAHPWIDTSHINNARNENEIYSLATSSHGDGLSSASSKTPSKSGQEQSRTTKLPDIAPVRMPDFGDSHMGFRMSRDIVKPTVASRFAKKHGRYISSSPERSDYDNVSGRNSLQDSGNHVPAVISSRNSDMGRYNYADDSDALSGYVGDVASSVYDSDEYDETPSKRFTQLYLNYDVDNEDPMAPFFPRLPPPQECRVTSESKLQKKSQNSSGSLNGKRSDYDNLDSDKLSEIYSRNDKKKKYLKTQAHIKSNENYQLQIAEEARRISLVFQNQWMTDKKVPDTNESKLSNNKKSDGNHRIKSFFVNSQRETSVESELSSMNINSNELAESHRIPYGRDKSVKSRSTDCLLTCTSTVPNNCSSDKLENELLKQESLDNYNKGLSKIIQRAERVRSLLPTELHSFILPGCFSSSSLNSSGKSSPIRQKLSKNIKSVNNHYVERQYFSDEERSNQNEV